MFSLDSNIDEIVARFKGYGVKIANADPSEALLVGINAAMGQMKNRIFNQGEDAFGVSLGPYTGKKTRFSKTPSREFDKKEQKAKDFLIGINTEFSEYELLRVKHGRQIRYKDLEFTGTLRRGILVLKDGPTKVTCLIPNSDLAKIANYNEEQIGDILKGGKASIFTFSEKEVQLLKDNTAEALKQIYERVFSS